MQAILLEHPAGLPEHPLKLIACSAPSKFSLAWPKALALLRIPH